MARGGATAVRGGRTSSSTFTAGGGRNASTAASTPAQDGNAPVCQHNEPAIRLECRNGQNAGRFFWKCNRPIATDKCRYFHWEDGQPTSKGAAAAPAASTSRDFRGQGNTLSGPSNTVAHASQSSSSTEVSTPAPSGSPNKRRREAMEAGGASSSRNGGDDDDDYYSSHPGLQSRSFPTSRQPARSKATSSSQPPIHSQSQTAEDAILDDWDEDIEDFDDFEAGGSGKKRAKQEPLSPSRRFTSFAGPPTTPTSQRKTIVKAEPPSTPPSRLAPGLPVTPNTTSNESQSSNRSQPVTAHGISKWQQIREDPSSPFHSRANALLGDGETPAAGGSQSSSGTASLLLTERDTAPPAANAAYETPTKTTLPEDTTSPSKSARSVSEHLSKFSDLLVNDLETLAKQVESTERQLKAMKQKAAYHEKREKDAQAELSRFKEKLRLVISENDQLKAMLG